MSQLGEMGDELDELLRAAENPPFDRARRLGVKIDGPLEDPPLVTISLSLRAGNAEVESAPKVLKTVRTRSREALESIASWVTRATDARGLAAPTIEENYAVAEPGHRGPPAALPKLLDSRLALAIARVSPQVLIAIHPMQITGENGDPDGCVCWARFQGTLITPHVISVLLFDEDLIGEDRALWQVLQDWSMNVAGSNRVSLG